MHKHRQMLDASSQEPAQNATAAAAAAAALTDIVEHTAQAGHPILS
jgi:hypothetical protein